MSNRRLSPPHRGVENIVNCLRLSPRIASSGQPEEDQFRHIARAGYHLVVNLAMPDSDHAIPEEGHIVAALGMDYVHIPVPFDAPTPDHLRRFLGVMRAYPAENLWIHCVVNYRASAFLYHYWRRDLGASEEEARSVLHPAWEPDPVWTRFMTTTE